MFDIDSQAIISVLESAIALTNTAPEDISEIAAQRKVADEEYDRLQDALSKLLTINVQWMGQGSDRQATLTNTKQLGQKKRSLGQIRGLGGRNMTIIKSVSLN
ncbi:MAG: hypothetical protein IPP22_09470 [Nitrosomonas sp.]|nr:hypothetical protein [Nitrosomonas sp.]